MVKPCFLAPALCAVSNVNAFGMVSRGLQTQTGAGLVHPTSLESIPSGQVNDVGIKSNKMSQHVPQKKHQKRNVIFKYVAKPVFSFAVIASTITSTSAPAYATAEAAEEIVEHLHVGQKIATYFRSFGIPDLAVLAMISAMPVVELRGAIPVGLWMGLPITKILPVCVLGNMAPIIPLMFLLRNNILKELMSPILSRAEKKSANLGVGSIEKQWVSLAAFVGIPLPGTGAWTGAMGAFLLDMPTAVALTSISTGVLSAGVIMTAIVLAGKKGGIAALAALALFTAREFFASKEGGDLALEDGEGD